GGLPAALGQVEDDRPPVAVPDRAHDAGDAGAVVVALPCLEQPGGPERVVELLRGHVHPQGRGRVVEELDVLAAPEVGGGQRGGGEHAGREGRRGAEPADRRGGVGGGGGTPAGAAGEGAFPVQQRVPHGEVDAVGLGLELGAPGLHGGGAVVGGEGGPQAAQCTCQALDGQQGDAERVLRQAQR